MKMYIRPLLHDQSWQRRSRGISLRGVLGVLGVQLLDEAAAVWLFVAM